MEATSSKHGDAEVDGDDQKSLFCTHVIQTFFEISLVGDKRKAFFGVFCIFFDVVLFVSDLRFKDCSQEKSYCIESKKWSS